MVHVDREYVAYAGAGLLADRLLNRSTPHTHQHAVRCGGKPTSRMLE